MKRGSKMKKKLKRIFAGLCAVLCIAALFSGCGASKYVAVSDLFTSGSIWCLCAPSAVYTYDRDSEIYALFLVEGDKIKEYPVKDDMTLGSLAKMDDSEVKEMIEAYYEAYCNDQMTKVLETYKTTVSAVISRGETSLVSSLRNIAKNTASSVADVYDYPYTSTEYHEYIVDSDEYIERYNAQLIFEAFSGLFSENAGGYLENDKVEQDNSDGRKLYYIYAIEFTVPIEQVRSEINTFYENYPDIKAAIDAVLGGEDAESVAENTVNTAIETVEASAEYQNLQAECEQLLAEEGGYDYQLAIVTDGTGNTARGEGLIYRSFSLSYGEEGVEKSYKTDTDLLIKDRDYPAYGMNIYETQDGNCIQVYDTYYGGWCYVDDDEGWALCTKLKKNGFVELDEVNEKKFLIDPTKSEIEAYFGEDDA